jgi:Transposase DDE domain
MHLLGRGDSVPLVIKQVFHLPLRAMSGLVGSLVQRMGLDFVVPSYSQVFRRQQRLEVAIPRSPPREEGLHLVVDSTGLKVFGEGEWKVCQHGYCKQRTWRKVHLGVDADAHEVVAALVTTGKFQKPFSSKGKIRPTLLAVKHAISVQHWGIGPEAARLPDAPSAGRGAVGPEGPLVASPPPMA